ncbi:MAG: hypothetical protein JXB32_26220 [Deltaproteobacteria bacterium]|nr:hypothetical protein [Deltaproteobacteria bacterium]
MQWMTKLDRALGDAIVRAARAGGDEARRLREIVAGVIRLDPRRMTSYFHVGFAEVLLGLEPSEVMVPPLNEARDRWYAFGKLVALSREHRDDEAAALASAEVALRMARDPQIAPDAIPLAVEALLRADAPVQGVELAWAWIRPDRPDEVQFFREAVRGALDRLPMFRRPVALGSASPPSDDPPRRPSTLDDSEIFLRRLADKASWQASLGPALRALVLHGLGRSAAHRGAFEEAQRHHLQAESAFEAEDPLRTTAIAWRALALLGTRAPGELRPGPAVRPEAARARELLLRAAGPGVTRTSVTGLYALGVLEREEGRHEEADRLFTLAAARLLDAPPADAGPVEPWVRFQRAQTLLRGRPATGSEELRAAGALLRESLEHVHPDPEELRRVADALDGLDDDRRRDILVRIALEEVEDVGALVMLSADLLAAGAVERALTAAERALILSVRPDHRYQALRSQLRALCGQGRNDEALDVYERLREHCLERGLRRELARFVLGEGRECGLVLPRERLLVLTQLGRLDPDALPDAEVPGAAARRRATLVELVRLYLGSHEDEDLASAEELIHELRAAEPEAAEELAARLAAQSTNRGVPVVPPPVPELALHVRYRFGGEPRLVAVGGAERDRETFERFAARGGELGYRAQWVPAHYDDPQRTLAEARAALEGGCRGLLLLHANRRVVRETLIALAREREVLLRRFDLHGAAGLAIHARLLLAQLVQRHALTGRG